MQNQLDADHRDSGTEERVGKALAVLGVVVTLLAIVTVVAGIFMD